MNWESANQAAKYKRMPDNAVLGNTTFGSQYYETRTRLRLAEIVGRKLGKSKCHLQMCPNKSEGIKGKSGLDRSLKLPEFVHSK